MGLQIAQNLKMIYSVIHALLSVILHAIMIVMSSLTLMLSVLVTNLANRSKGNSGPPHILSKVSDIDLSLYLTIVQCLV